MPGYGDCPYGQFPYGGGCGFPINPVIYKVDNDNEIAVEKIENSGAVIVYDVLTEVSIQVSPYVQGYGAGLYGTGLYGSPIGGEPALTSSKVQTTPRAIVYNVMNEVKGAQ